ncbi:MAG: calcium-binding protein [Pseudomonadota bacterium]
MTIFLGDGDEIFIGMGANRDTVNGGAGTDFIDLGAGNDTAEAEGNEAEFDTLIGGAGNDQIVNISAGPLVLNNFNDGVQVSGFERIVLNDQELLGNDGDNVFNFAGIRLDGATAVRTLGGDDTVTVTERRIETYDLGDDDDTAQVFGNAADRDILIGGAGTDEIVNIGESTFSLSGFNDGARVTGFERIDGNGYALEGDDRNNVFDFTGVAVDDVDRIFAEGGNDTVIGTERRNEAYDLGDGDDSFSGSGNRKDTVNGGDGVDTIDTGGGNDTIEVARSEAEFDTIHGGSGKDQIVNVGSGSFRLANFNDGTQVSSIERIAGDGGDLLGTSDATTFDFSGVRVDGIDEIRTLGGDDVVIGTERRNLNYDLGSGDDTFTATGGSKNTVFGDIGEDTIIGGAGRDSLNGGGDDDLLTGNGDQDTFTFDGPFFGNDTITDFESGIDRANFSGSGLSFADFDANNDGVLNAGDASGGRVDIVDGSLVLTVDSGNASVTFEDVTELSDQDIAFA